MVEINIVRSGFEDGKFQREVVAHLRVDGQQVELDGDRSVLPLDRELLNLRDGSKVSFERNPEEWARSLPGTLRGPNLAAEVVEDSDPVPEPEAAEQPPRAAHYAQWGHRG
jgi:hypothetical protein